MSFPSDFTSSPVKHSPWFSIFIHQFIPLIHYMLISSSFPICLSSSFPFLLFTHDHFYPMPTNKLDSNPLQSSAETHLPWPCARQATYLGSVTKSGWKRCMMKSLSLKSLGLWELIWDVGEMFGKSSFRDHQKQNRFWRDEIIRL